MEEKFMYLGRCPWVQLHSSNLAGGMTCYSLELDHAENGRGNSQENKNGRNLFNLLPMSLVPPVSEPVRTFSIGE